MVVVSEHCEWQYGFARGLVDFALDQQYGCADHRQCQPSSLFTLAKTRWTAQIKLGLKGTLHSARKLHDMVN